MSEPTVRRRADGGLELFEPEGCDDPVMVALPLLRELVAAQSIVSLLTEQVMARFNAQAALKFAASPDPESETR